MSRKNSYNMSATHDIQNTNLALNDFQMNLVSQLKQYSRYKYNSQLSKFTAKKKIPLAQSVGPISIKYQASTPLASRNIVRKSKKLVNKTESANVTDRIPSCTGGAINTPIHVVDENNQCTNIQVQKLKSKMSSTKRLSQSAKKSSKPSLKRNHSSKVSVSKVKNDAIWNELLVLHD